MRFVSIFQSLTITQIPQNSSKHFNSVQKEHHIELLDTDFAETIK